MLRYSLWLLSVIGVSAASSAESPESTKSLDRDTSETRAEVADDVTSSPQHYEQLVATLGAGSFSQREAAAAALINAGEPAFPAVDAATRQADEAGLRAVRILEAWAFDRTGPFAVRAEQRLMSLADGDHPRLSAEARAALNTARDVREERATEAILQHNGEVRRKEFGHVYHVPTGPIPLYELAAPAELIGVYHDWSGGIEQLWQLRRFEHQSGLTIRIANGDLPDPDVMALASVLESATLTFVGASLGLRADVASPLIIGEVFPGTAAHNAGLRRGDMIVEFDNIQIGSISDLIQALRQYEPGDTGVLRYIRRGELESAIVELQGWREMPTPKQIMQQLQQQRIFPPPFQPLPRNQNEPAQPGLGDDSERSQPLTPLPVPEPAQPADNE